MIEPQFVNVVWGFRIRSAKRAQAEHHRGAAKKRYNIGCFIPLKIIRRFRLGPAFFSDLRPLTSVSMPPFRLNAFEQFGVRSIQVVSKFHRCLQSVGIYLEAFS